MIRNQREGARKSALPGWHWPNMNTERIRMLDVARQGHEPGRGARDSPPHVRGLACAAEVSRVRLHGEAVG